MGKSNPEKLIEDIIRFIETERELYGDFTPGTLLKHTEENRQAEDTNSVQEESDQPHQEASISDAMDSQEALFSDNPEREVYYKIKDCNTLEELEALCHQADVLHTDLDGTNLVFGVGNPDADLMLIGEAPGAEEDKRCEPFVGAAGQLLNKILEAIGFERDDVYIANILKHRPPNNRNPKPEERERSLPFLLRQIDLINPKLILSLGKVSAQTLLDNDNSLSSMRGEFHSFRGKYELMPTYHPAALLRHAKWKRPTWEDVQLLRKRYDELNCKP
ncbi:MAG: uracil-DNA glycosylase [Balneolaceae bacterium]|nr:uracil-DNA glycosylase [Balneolaceae bacterium]